MRSVVLSIFFIFSFAHAHDGHDHGSPPAAIENGKLQAKDSIIYLDAGADVEWMGQKLKRKITATNQIVYQYSDAVKELSVLSNDETKYLNLKVTGGEVLKAFGFDHAGELHDQIELTSPDFTNDVVISRDKELQLRWKADLTASMIKVIIETYSASGSLTGRLTISTNDDGDFSVPLSYLNQLPSGNGKIAIKRIWLGEFQPNEKTSDTIGVKSVVSIVGKVKVQD